MTRLILLIVAVTILTGCNNNEETSPFGDLLNQQPYAPLTDSLKKEPKNAELYFKRAVLFNSNGLPEPALADFEKAWSLDKQEKYAYAIGTLILDKSSDSATVFLSNALKDIPKSTLLRLSLAHALNNQQRYDDALRMTDEILQINPQQVDVLKLKADIMEKKGNIEESVRTLEKAYALAPFDIELNNMLALRYAEIKNPKVLALADSLVAADSLKIHADPYYYKGIYYANTGETDKAIANFDQAIKTEYNFFDAYIEKGSIYYEQKNYKAASGVFSLVIRIDPTYAPAHYWLGKCQEALGDKQEAKLSYQRAYGLDKSFAEAKAAADKL